MSETKQIQVPRYFKPWPHQVAAWQRRDSGKYNYYAELWARQLGKDSSDIQHANWSAWNNPGTQTAYVGLNNVWVSNNIFKKYIDNRTFWQDYPDDKIRVNDTQKEVYMMNNPKGIAPARIKFIGFLQDAPLVGSSYDRFYLSEMGLYRSGAFDYVRPIWERKLAAGEPLFVNINGTPRGQRNVYYEMLKTLTGKEDPNDFPGEHGNVYVDKLTIYDAWIPDPETGQPRRLYSDAYIEQLKDSMLREFGNLNLFNQEYMCDFTTVNAGLVYQGIERLMKGGRYKRYEADLNRPIYMAWDIANKANDKNKVRDSNAAIIFQYYNGNMFIVDHYESRGLALAECINELRTKPYFHAISMGILPWDAGLDKTIKSLKTELEEMFPNIMWHILGQTAVQRGVEMAWKLFPNLIIDNVNNGRVLDCFMKYEFVRNEKTGVWASPRHTDVSHIMDAFRYAAVAINEIDYLKLNNSFMNTDNSWHQWDESEEAQQSIPATWKKPPKVNDDEQYQKY